MRRLALLLAAVLAAAPAAAAPRAGGCPRPWCAPARVYPDAGLAGYVVRRRAAGGGRRRRRRRLALRGRSTRPSPTPSRCPAGGSS